ncbi:MAG: agmatine deiminase family protein [Tannerellaceae bacterium]|jgi:agmatine/peptidylarginine deiminase|nr:agmatine deiminase family protein [Tannerellaceae bacterium]
MSNIIFPAEWHTQSGVMLTWPHEDTDWAGALEDVLECFTSIACEIVKCEKLLVVCADVEEARERLRSLNPERIIFRQVMSNDSWARDHAGIPVYLNDSPRVCDFTFNGWGMKYPACRDNMITRRLFELDAYAPGVRRIDMQPFVLEGGSIESDGCGTLLTTRRCLASDNRNEHMTCEAIEEFLGDALGVRRILWLEHGHIEGDDTDSHVDTLARFCSEDSIAYVRCTDTSDESYESLAGMERELKAFRRENGEPYRLMPLPMAERIEQGGRRLPATYANFLVINGAVLVPFYNSPLDEEAALVLGRAFPGRKIKGVNCLPLIAQGGSLHCVTMQYPQKFL